MRLGLKIGGVWEDYVNSLKNTVVIKETNMNPGILITESGRKFHCENVCHYGGDLQLKCIISVPSDLICGQIDGEVMRGISCDGDVTSNKFVGKVHIYTGNILSGHLKKFPFVIGYIAHILEDRTPKVDIPKVMKEAEEYVVSFDRKFKNLDI